MRRIAALLTLVLFVIVTTAPALACLTQSSPTTCCCKQAPETATAICPVDCCTPGRPLAPHQDRTPQDLLLRAPSLALFTVPIPEDSVLLPHVAHRAPIHSLAPPLRLRI